MNQYHRSTTSFESLKAWSARHTAVAQFFDLPRRILDRAHFSEEVFDQLLQGATHPNPKVRWSCAHLADHIDDVRCFEILYRLCQDPVPRVRAEALHGLACERCKTCPLPIDAVAILVDAALNDPSYKVREKVVATFSFHSPDVRIREALTHLSQHDPHPKIRQKARRAVKYHSAAGQERDTR